MDKIILKHTQSFYISLLVIFFSYLYCSQLYGQEIDISPYIKAWNVKDDTQTLRFEESLVFFTDSDFNKVPFLEKHNTVVNLAEEYLKQNPNKRITIRLLLYEVLAKRYHGSTKETVVPRILESFKLAYELADYHLISELYMVYARYHRADPEFIIYTIKALKIQEIIGKEKFPRYHNGLFDLCMALYHTNDFEGSISYGHKFLEEDSKIKFDKKADIYSYFYTLDLIGANYFKLKEYDKAYHYHKKLLDTIEKGVFIKSFQRRWKGIAKASVGQTLFEQQKVEESIPYLQSALKTSLEEEVWNTAAETQNILAQIDFDNKEYQTALTKWKEAYNWIFKSKMDIPEPLYYLRYKISGNIAKVYHKMQQTDSTYYYLNRANQEQLLYEKNIQNKNFNLINANLNFEEAESNLKISEEKLNREKMLRNGILIGLFLLGVIVLLVLYQKKLQQRVLIQQKNMAEEKVAEAKKSIMSFKKYITEKEQLIEQLKKSENIENSKKKLLDYILVTDEEWLKFKEDFTKAYPDFLSELKKQFPNPTPAEERLLYLISLNLGNMQIATMLGIGEESVARSKRRLKNRINLPDNILLEEYIYNLRT